MTKKEKIRRNQLWADALRKNKKKARNIMRKNGGRCCLAVAEDVAIQNGCKATISDPYAKIPKRAIAKWYGWDGTNPELDFGISFVKTASECNDGFVCFFTQKKHKKIEFSHKEIADLVEQTFCK